MTSLERVRRVIRGEPADRLPAQPMAMMFAARHAGMAFIDYTQDGRRMAEAQLRLVGDFGPAPRVLTGDDAILVMRQIGVPFDVEWAVVRRTDLFPEIVRFSFRAESLPAMMVRYPAARSIRGNNSRLRSPSSLAEPSWPAKPLRSA